MVPLGSSMFRRPSGAEFAWTKQQPAQLGLYVFIHDTAYDFCPALQAFGVALNGFHVLERDVNVLAAHGLHAVPDDFADACFVPTGAHHIGGVWAPAYGIVCPDLGSALCNIRARRHGNASEVLQGTQHVNLAGEIFAATVVYEPEVFVDLHLVLKKEFIVKFRADAGVFLGSAEPPQVPASARAAVGRRPFEVVRVRHGLVLVTAQRQITGVLGILVALKNAVAHECEQAVELLGGFVHIDHDLFKSAQPHDIGADVGHEAAISRPSFYIDGDDFTEQFTGAFQILPGLLFINFVRCDGQLFHV